MIKNKNLMSMDDFKGKKSTKIATVNEMVDAIDDVYRVSVEVKESTGKDLRAEMGEKRLAERLVQWANENYLNIENLPVEIVTGSDKGPVQPQAQVQSQIQEEPEDGSQPQTQAQVQPAGQTQPVQNTQAQKPAVQVQGQQQAQSAAAQVPAQEI